MQNFVSESGRFVVKVDGEQANIALMPDNLQAAPAIGSTVILVSLASRSDLNGRMGIVHGFKCETTCFEVKVDGEDAILLLQPQNLREVVSSDTSRALSPTADQERVAMKVQELAEAGNWRALFAMAGHAIETARDLRDAKPEWAVGIYIYVGGCYRRFGEYAKGIEMNEECLAFATKVGNRAGQGVAYANLGVCYQLLGQYARAIEQHEHSLTMKREVGDRAGQGTTYNNLGICYHSLGMFDKAIQLFEEALAIKEEVGIGEGKGTTLSNLGSCYMSLRQYAKAIELHEQALTIFEEGNQEGKAGASLNLGNCYYSLGQYAEAIKLLEQALAILQEVGDKAGQGRAYSGLGNCYESLGEYVKAIQLHKHALSISEQVGNRLGQGNAWNNLGNALSKSGDATGAARALVRGLVVKQRVEQDVGVHDDRRVSMFEEQQKTYRRLQDVLLGQAGQEGWALGVASQAKGRALAYHLGWGSGGQDESGDWASGDQAVDRPYEEVCESWWVEVQRLARAEGRTTCVLEFSFLSDEKMGIWVVAGATGELLCSKVVASTGLGGSGGRSIQEVLAEARSSMNVRGRDAMSGSAPDAAASSSSSSTVTESVEHLGDLLSTDGGAASAARGPRRDLSQVEVVKREVRLLQELYAALIEPVQGALEGAEELLILPHQELYEVPWAALTDSVGGYLIERHAIRTSPSLRVARQAADKVQTCGHVVLVGNPLPIPQRFRPLNFADKEVDSIHKILNTAGLEVLPKHHFRENLDPPATKANVKNSLQGAAWAHMALHGDLETDSLVLAIPFGSADQDKDSGLSMREVQGSEQEQVQGVQMAAGATVVLSACNTGRGEIKAEGVVGIARGFLLANASAAVVSLWSVDDSSTAALMRIKYTHLAQGCTVPEALRLAMLRLARPRSRHAEDVADGLQEDWKRPMHWAGFLVVGAATRLPSAGGLGGDR